MSEGEGSRGGHVIGHTKSGRPVYGDPRTREALKALTIKHGYTAEDHQDAANLLDKHNPKNLSDLRGVVDLKWAHLSMKHEMNGAEQRAWRAKSR